MRIAPFLLVVIFIVSGCASAQTDQTPPSSLEQQRAESLAKIDRAACAAKGGRVVQLGLLGLWGCEIPFADAGKACHDKSDCAGHCYAADNTDRNAPPGRAMGKCQPTNSPFGCHAEINNGVVEPTLCVD